MFLYETSRYVPSRYEYRTAQPPLKKARTEDNGNSDDSTAPTFFLHAISVEVQDNVLRFFSQLPRADDWVPHIPVEIIIELHGVKGELGTHMKPRFNMFYVSDCFKYRTGHQTC